MNHLPQLARREFFRVGSVGVAGYSLLPMIQPANVQAKEIVKPRGQAEVCILLFLGGGPSQVDTFDVKEGPWTPEDFDIQTVQPGLRMPVGLMPKLSKRTDKYAIVRSMNFWETDHTRGTYYLQAGRIISPARLKEIPSVGSVVAHESQSERKDTDYLPPFIAMNMDAFHLVGSGILPSECAPMPLDGPPTPQHPKLEMDTSFPFVVADSERAAFERRRHLLNRLDRGPERAEARRDPIFPKLGQNYQSAQAMLTNTKTTETFTVTPQEHQRFGSTGLGDACILARNLVQANAGTKFIMIYHGPWDLHGRAYSKEKYPDGTYGFGQYRSCAELDNALSGLLDELEASTDEKGRRLIDKTLVLAMGEFGRTVGELNKDKGRDHHRDAGIALLAGAGVTGGKVIGATDKLGGTVVQSGWHKDRPIYPEDVLVTLYSAMGIDWTKKISPTPSGRTFEYIENISPKGAMQFDEISELFT